MNSFEIKENRLIENIKTKYKLKIEEACFSNGWIPKHLLLDRTRNIHSYLIFMFKHGYNYRGRFFNESDNFEHSINEIVKIQYSQLDRPLFFIIEDEDSQIFAIEGNTIREGILDEKNRFGINEILDNETLVFEKIVPQIKSEL